MTELNYSADALANPLSFAKPKFVYDLYRHLRNEQPLALAAPRGYRPFWVMSRYEDIAAVERNSELYEAAPRTVLLPEKVEAHYREKYGNPNGVAPITHMDGEYHRAHRAVTFDWFTPRNLASFEAAIARMAKEFVDRMEDYGNECDFARDIAYWYPLRVVMTLMGVPPEDESMVLYMTQRLFSPADKSVKAQPSWPQSQDVVVDFANYFHALGEERIKAPRNDIISTIANGKIHECPMAYHEATSYYIIAATAGHDTTAASIAGGMNGLLEFPAEFEKLKNGSPLQPAADEFVRWTAPVKHFMRTPREDVEWHGCTISAGDAIMLCYPSACRDERIFPDGDQFKVDRPQRPMHLAFGHGPHFCLGKNLALMEIRAFYQELLSRVKSVELAGEPTYIESTFVSGHKSLPVRFRF